MPINVLTHTVVSLKVLVYNEQIYKYIGYSYKPVLKVHHWGWSLAVNEFKTTKVKALCNLYLASLRNPQYDGSLQIHPYTLFFHRMFVSFCTQNCQCSPVSSYLIHFSLVVLRITSCLFTNSLPVHRHSFPQNSHHYCFWVFHMYQ